jgi:hypothetical protein
MDAMHFKNLVFRCPGCNFSTMREFTAWPYEDLADEGALVRCPSCERIYRVWMNAGGVIVIKPAADDTPAARCAKGRFVTVTEEVAAEAAETARAEMARLMEEGHRTPPEESDE